MAVAAPGVRNGKSHLFRAGHAFNNVAAPFIVCVMCGGMLEEEELLKNPDDDSASGIVAHQLGMAGKIGNFS